MALWPTPQESCFYLDPNAGLDDANNWRDLSPHQLNVLPVGYAAPSFGIFTGPSGAKAINFNGTNQRGELPLRFYQIANLPSTEITIAVVARWNAPAVSDALFYAYNATTGVSLNHPGGGSAPDRLALSGYDGATQAYTNWTGSHPLTSRTRVCVLSLNVTTTTLGQYGCWVDREQPATQSRINTIASISYPANAPIVGSAGAANYFDGDLYCLSIYNRVWSDAESKAFSDFWLNRT